MARLSMADCTLHAWRHPRVEAAAGRCLGRTDLPVDRRRSKRLAHRIRAHARRERLPHQVVTSPLTRTRDVGRWLARWGWAHRVDPALSELDFGEWDGRPWSEVARADVDAWCADFLHHPPGGGETLAQLLARVRHFDPGAARVLVTHGGWLSAALWCQHGAGASPTPATWPAAPVCARRTELPWPLRA